MKQWAACVTGFFLAVVLPVGAFAQVNATVGGTVSDATGALIPGVEIRARNVNTGIVTTGLTNETGNYVFPSLQPGVYTVSAALSGFRTATFSNVQLSQGQQVRLNFSLQVDALATAVEVVAEANTLLSATAASVGNILPEREVLSLPVASRNVLDFVTTAVGGVGVAGGFGGATAFAGVETNQVNTTRDGLVTNDGRYNNSVYSAVFTSPDLVEEVRVSVTSIDAGLGRGNAQVQMRTRAGTNDFHGALFYTNNNSAFNSLGWFQNLVGAEKSFLNRNQYGGRVGGPIVRNKAFFFVLIDQQRTLLKDEVLTTVLTGPARQGVFRYLTENAAGAAGGAARRNGNAFSTTPSVDLTGNLLSSHNGVPLFMNTINVFSDVQDPNRTRIDPVWVAPQLLPRMPMPNDWTVGDGLNTAGFRWLRRHDGEDGATGQSSNTNRDHLTVRADYQVNADNKLTYTMSREENWGVTGQTGLPAVPDGFFGDVVRVPDFYTASWTSTLSPTILNEFRFGYKRDTWQGTSPYDKGCCWGGRSENDDLVESAKQARASFPTVDGYMLQVGGGLGFPAYAPFGVASPRASVSPFKQFADTLNWTQGAHSFQTGFDISFASSNQANHGGQATTRPRATLGVGNVPVPDITTANYRGLSPNDIGTAQNLLASLAGTVQSLQQQYFINDPQQSDWLGYKDTFLFRRDIHQNDWAAFFKDNWKVTNNFTLNLGLRYDKYGTPYDTYGLGGRFTGGQSGLFGISGTGFSAMWNPYAAGGTLTTTEFVGKHSPNPDKVIWGNDWNNFAPSVGFSWSVPWFDRSTVVRGGYGVNYAGTTDFLSYSGSIGNLPGQTLVVDFSPSTYMDLSRMGTANLVPLPTGGAQPFEAVPLTNRSVGITGYADDRRIPYVQSFNLAIQRELTPTLTLDVGYVGNKSTKLFSSTQLNETNIFENGILDAFNVTRAGGNAPLFDRIFMGLSIPGSSVVNGTTLSGSQALRRYTTTNAWLANGEVGAFANWLNSTSALTGQNGGLLRRAGLPENFIVVNPQFGSVNLAGNNNNANYHSLQTVLNKRTSRGLSGQFSHTWSKGLGATGIRDPRNRRLSQGLQSSDRTHVFKANGTYELPFGPNRLLLSSAPGFVHRIVEGWQLSGIFVRATGAPLDFSSTRSTVSSRSSNTADLAGVLPKNLGKVKVGDGRVEYFEGLSTQRAPLPNYGGDTTLPGRFTNQVVVDSAGNIVLQNPSPGAPGNMAENLSRLKGPPTLSFDMAVTKRIQIREGTAFTLRVDAINALNSPQWNNPETDINSANFGRITGASGSRTVTINARIDF
jgi:hypothetical protein